MDGYFYLHRSASAWFNMAFDEWLFDRLRTEEGPRLYLRLYSWESGAITFGYNQHYEKAVKANLIDKDIPIIRRITGGRAIFHDPTEFTVTIASRIDFLSKELRPLSESNKVISSVIVRALKSAGLDTEWKRQTERKFVEKSESAAACFDSVTRYEVTAENAKIAGGAQRRVGNRFIHQGSLKVNGVGGCPAIGQKEAKSPPLINEGGGRITLENFLPHFVAEFTAVFGIPLERVELSREERIQVANEMAVLQKNPFSKRPPH